ncbi:MAG: antibiotic biosynthesis monooxygenase [Puniceicoccales bacterium]|jgi:quinol monooxygenase YgiN|nr:antibiotic biosynthesis monooxygenase [Puniceicoccales bacterium]
MNKGESKIGTSGVNKGKREFLKRAGVVAATVAVAPWVAGAACCSGAKKIITAKIRVAKGKEGEFVSAAKEVVAATRREKGNVAYDFLGSQEDGRLFVFVELWKDQTAIEAHFASAHFKAFGEVLGKLAEGKPEIVIYDIAAQKSV